MRAAISSGCCRAYPQPLIEASRNRCTIGGSALAKRILAKLPAQVPVSDPIGFVRYQTEVARKLARYPDVPLGHSNPERWSRIQQSLIDIGAISRPVDLDTFLYEPAAAVRHR